MPAAGYPIEFLSVSGLDRRNPVRALGAVARAGAAVGDGARPAGAARRGRRAGRRRLRRRAGRPGGGGTPHAARAERGGQPPRPREPHARAVRAPRVPGVPDRGTRRATAISSRAARCRARWSRPTATRRARGSAFRADVQCVLVFGGSLGARSVNLAAVEALGDAACTSCTSPGTRDFDEVRDRVGDAARLPRCSSTWTRWPTRSPPAIWWSRGRAARCSRSPPRAGPRSWSRIRTRPPTIRRRTRTGWRTRAPRSCCPTRARSPSACARRSHELLGDPTGSRGWRGAARAVARPDAAQRIAARGAGGGRRGDGAAPRRSRGRAASCTSSASAAPA